MSARCTCVGPCNYCRGRTMRDANALAVLRAERDRLAAEVETLRARLAEVEGERDRWQRAWQGADREWSADRARLAAAEALHVERGWRPLDGTYLGGTVCGHCRRPWPCSTITALEVTPDA